MNKRSINQDPIPWKQHDVNSLKIACLNVMNLKNNFEDIICDKTIMESALVAFSETWLNEGENLPIDGYKSHYTSVGPGKGLAVYFKGDIFKHVIDIKEDKMQLSKFKSSNLEVIAVYRSERGNPSEVLKHIIDMISPRVNTVIWVDFNICYMSQRNNKITKYLEENGFTQLMQEATHIKGRLLDHFYFRASEDDHLETSVFRYSPYYADHDAICTTITSPQC